MTTEKLHFKTSSGIKSIVGKDLITDKFVAIFELVKNSYDAGAKQVTITFDKDKIAARFFKVVKNIGTVLAPLILTVR